MWGGYANRILEVNLNDGSSTSQALPDDVLRAFVGGRGLGTKLLWDRTPAGMDPLSPESPFMVLTGPLTALAPGGAHTTLVFKSPLTRITLAHPVTGANFGPELKFAGYDGVIIRGKAPKPTYLYINDKSVELRDASRIWGKGTIESERLLKEDVGDPYARVLVIGPAGENLVRFAGVQQEYFRSAARGGGGCVMGSKNLKAIVVRGKGGTSVASPKTFLAVRAEAEKKLRDGAAGTRRGYYLRRWGSSISSLAHSDLSELDVRNYREAYWDGLDDIGGLEFERQCRVSSRSCFSCPVCCMQVGVIREGRYAGTVACPDFDSTGTIGPGCLVTDLHALLYLNALGDDLGVDNISMGNVTSFAMECYEKGLITRNDLGGIDLTWGSVEAMEALWRMIVAREGIGDLLSRGVKEASKAIGGGSEHFAMHVKGQEFAGYTPHAHPDRALQYAVGDRGACHHYGLTVEEQNFRAWADSLVMCTWHQQFLPLSTYLDLINTATEWNVDNEEWDRTAERMLVLARAYNIREGMVPLRDEVLPNRVHSEPLSWGPKKGVCYPVADFQRDRAEWYRARGCNEAGVPTREHLRELGLEFAIAALEDAGAYSN